MRHPLINLTVIERVGKRSVDNVWYVAAPIKGQRTKSSFADWTMTCRRPVGAFQRPSLCQSQSTMRILSTRVPKVRGLSPCPSLEEWPRLRGRARFTHEV